MRISDWSSDVCSSDLIEPGADVIGMAHGRRDAEARAAEGRRHFGDELLARIGLRPEATAQVAREASGMARPMPQLMQGRAMPVDRLEIGLGPGDLYEIRTR